MIIRKHSEDNQPSRCGEFASTHWSVVLAAAQTQSPEACEALATLCAAYWYPLYAYVRRKGYSPPEAEDLTQEFFSRLLQNGALQAADPARGRFRSYLLALLQRMLVSEWRHGHRQKRGGGTTTFSLDDHEAEDGYRLEPWCLPASTLSTCRHWGMALTTH